MQNREGRKAGLLALRADRTRTAVVEHTDVRWRSTGVEVAGAAAAR